MFPFVEKAAEKNEFLTSLLEAYLPVTILLIIINLLYFALKVRCSKACFLLLEQCNGSRRNGIEWNGMFGVE